MLMIFLGVYFWEAKASFHKLNKNIISNQKFFHI